MPNPRALLKRRKAVAGMRKITKTMEMVATARLVKAHHAAVSARPYARGLTALISELACDAEGFDHPLLKPHAAVRKVLALVLTSDRGLCGAFNSNIIRQARELNSEMVRRRVAVDYVVQGRKGAAALRHLGLPVSKSYLRVSDRPDYARAEEIGAAAVARFRAGEIDEFRVIYSSFASRTSQVPTTQTLLPLASPAGKPAAGRPAPPPAAARVWYLHHPGAAELLAELLPLMLNTTIYNAMLETCAGEHSARMVAMKNATDAAEDMISTLNRAYNRARQSKITQEIAEIVGGAEAL